MEKRLSYSLVVLICLIISISSIYSQGDEPVEEAAPDEPVAEETTPEAPIVEEVGFWESIGNFFESIVEAVAGFFEAKN